ncbi:hypothetical protein I312_105887 [Cryptococcus bacillisporus CA1280]|uniref:uncharacterized protein n=1 Tax=Cryptococcus bacillisporus CA1280 TaxID=1296109 RepID=UPI003365B40D
MYYRGSLSHGGTPRPHYFWLSFLQTPGADSGDCAEISDWRRKTAELLCEHGHLAVYCSSLSRRDLAVGKAIIAFWVKDQRTPGQSLDEEA